MGGLQTESGKSVSEQGKLWRVHRLSSEDLQAAAPKEGLPRHHTYISLIG